jgi:dihydrofolate reductase
VAPGSLLERLVGRQPSLPHAGLCADPPSPRAAGDGGRHPFFFVVDGIESALEQAKQAAGDRDVLLGGGASVVQQYLAAGLVDEFELHLVPVLLGDGERLLENVGDLQVQQVRAVEAPGVTHIKYRVVKDR